MAGYQDDSHDPLAADVDAPHLTVHCLSEFVFCPRAGLCLYEQDDEYDEREEEANLSFLPMHEPEQLGLVLERLIRDFMWIVFGGLGSILVFFLGAWYSGWIGLWVAFAGALLLTTWGLCDRGYRAYWAQRGLEMWQAAKPRMPDAKAPRIQELDWRDLIASGVAIMNPPASFRKLEWNLGGKPWRILEYEDLRIPVFKTRRPWKGLFRQHFVRMAAYCQLIESEEGFDSPYGVIVKGDTFAAVTIPNTPKTQAMVRQALLAARRTIRDSEEIDEFPQRPKDGLCGDCPVGSPQRLHRDKWYMRHGMTVTAYPVSVDGKVEYHSHCGDRFRWLPPHKWARQIGLTAG